MNPVFKRCSWAIVTPSAEDSVAYFHSVFASAAATGVSHNSYLAVVLERESFNETFWVAFLVQPLSYPLPEFYLPIAPSSVGPRSAVQPGFKWPFDECVIDTVNKFIFYPSTVVGTPHIVPEDIALSIFSIYESDSAEITRRMLECGPQLLQAKKEADGFGDDKGSRWTDFSTKSTYVRPIPGEFFAPAFIRARVSYDIESLKHFLPASQCFEDEKAITK
ncbi:hypothetical protein B0H10DRAFT_1299000 [Mycena sp. CBHHK59/15]|nr:hypothetical protein B0H10DRAFT_1299000 [Mycena sp. CBHHK59/15]